MLWKRWKRIPVVTVPANTTTFIRSEQWRQNHSQAVRIGCSDETCFGGSQSWPMNSLCAGIIELGGICRLCGAPLLAEIKFEY